MEWRVVRSLVWDASDGVCSHCGTALEREKFEVDHLIASCLGGTDDLDNLVVSCGPCNAEKGKRDVSTWRARRKLLPVVSYAVEEWLLRLLLDGPIPRPDVFSRGYQKGFSKREIHLAAREIGAGDQRRRPVGSSGGCPSWSLSPHPSPNLSWFRDALLSPRQGERPSAICVVYGGTDD